MTSFQAGLLRVHVCDDRAALGRAAAAHIANFLRAKLRGAETIAAVFAAAPSQTETLAALADEPDIAWGRVEALHLDEYVGATANSAHSFRRYLMENLIGKVKLLRFEGLRGEAADLRAECARYTAEWSKASPAVALIGIGENGHIAFNDPPDSRFGDPETVRIVELTEECRVQQVHDGTFPTLDAVPKTALTVSIPAVYRIPELFIMVPGARKAQAVKASLEGPVLEVCPGSILRTHPHATLFLDRESAALLT